jgi:hypothetical protein
MTQFQDDIFNEMTAISKLDDLNKIWDRWNKIADTLIGNLSLADIQKDIQFGNDSEWDLEWIQGRFEYLADRADPMRCYQLDFAIRLLMGKTLRECEGL